MKIAYLVSDVDVPVLGRDGCSIHVRELINAFADQGHDVFALCAWLGDGARRPQARLYEVVPRGVDAQLWEALAGESAVQSSHLERDLRSLHLNTVWARDCGAEVVDRERPDVLYERYSLFGTAGLTLAQRLGVPLILEVNAPLVREQSGYKKFPLEHTAEVVEGEIFRNADAIIAVSSWIARYVVERGANPAMVHVIPNGVSSQFVGSPDGDGVRRLYGLEGRRVVGYAGSFKKWHDLDGLLAAFADVNSGDDSATLLLVGDGPTRRRISDKATECGLAHRVVFTGTVPHDVMATYLAAMDIVAVPYREDPDFYFSPLKLFEAMASGRPTIAARVGQIADVVEHGHTGWLYQAGNRHELVAAVQLLFREPRRAAALGAAARHAVQAERTWQAVARKIAALAEQLRRS